MVHSSPTLPLPQSSAHSFPSEAVQELFTHSSRKSLNLQYHHHHRFHSSHAHYLYLPAHGHLLLSGQVRHYAGSENPHGLGHTPKCNVLTFIPFLRGSNSSQSFARRKLVVRHVNEWGVVSLDVGSAATAGVRESVD